MLSIEEGELPVNYLLATGGMIFWVGLRFIILEGRY